MAIARENDVLVCDVKYVTWCLTFMEIAKEDGVLEYDVLYVMFNNYDNCKRK